MTSRICSLPNGRRFLVKATCLSIRVAVAIGGGGGGTGSASQVDILSNSPWAKIPPSGTSVARISTFPTYRSLQGA